MRFVAARSIELWWVYVWFLISELVTRAIPVPNAEIRNQKVSVASETFWFLISELKQSLFPIQKSDIREFLNLQTLSDSWFLNCLSYQHLLPTKKLESESFWIYRNFLVFCSHADGGWCRSTKGAPNLWQCHILPHIGSVARHLFRLCTRDGMYEPSFQWSISWPHKPC